MSLRLIRLIVALLSLGFGPSFLHAGEGNSGDADIGDGPVVQEHVGEEDCESGKLSFDDLIERGRPRRDTRELNPYAYVANNPVNETDPSGLAIWLCNRKAFTRFGPGNHTYFWDDRNGRCCGRGSQLKCKEAGPPTDSCRKVEGSDGHEHKILECCRYNDWGTFWPISNDCHVLTNTCLAITGMKNPGAPGGRFGPPCDPCSK